MLEQEGRPQHWHPEGFAAVAGAEWRDVRGKLIGEVDLAITHPPADKHCGGAPEVVAIVEMKAAVFEIAAAAAQHTDHIVAAIESNLAFLVAADDGGTQPALPLRSDAGGHGGGGLTRVGGVAVFVATLVPPQPYLLGADPLIVRAVGEALFGRRKDPSQGGAPARSWTQPTLDPDDVVACGELMQAVRTVAKAKRHNDASSRRGGSNRS